MKHILEEKWDGVRLRIIIIWHIILIYSIPNTFPASGSNAWLLHTLIHFVTQGYFNTMLRYIVNGPQWMQHGMVPNWPTIKKILCTLWKKNHGTLACTCSLWNYTYRFLLSPTSLFLCNFFFKIKKNHVYRKFHFSFFLNTEINTKF